MEKLWQRAEQDVKAAGDRADRLGAELESQRPPGRGSPVIEPRMAQTRRP